MSPEQITQALHAALADILDCAESATERELLIGFALTTIEQCEQQHPSEIFREQIEKMRTQLAVTVPLARIETEPTMPESAVLV